MNQKKIVIALAKGRLAKKSMELLERCGLLCDEFGSDTRKLLFDSTNSPFSFILVKAQDVPTYVEYGVADIGIVGKDVILEEGKNVYEMLDLGYGRCYMAVCGKPSLAQRIYELANLRVATKYPNIAREYFHQQKGVTIEIVKLHGSVELAPLVGLSDVIVDIVESGATLFENGLEPVEKIVDISARLIVNRVSIKTNKQLIMGLLGKLKANISL